MAWHEEQFPRTKAIVTRVTGREPVREVTCAAVVIVLVAATATTAFADHPGPFRIEGMSPLMTALLTGGLAFVVALVVVIVIMVLTRKGPDRK